MYPDVIPFIPQNQPNWATVIPRRTPEFKLHNNLGHAKNAIQGCYGWHGDLLAVYERQEGVGWVKRLELPSNLSRTEMRQRLSEIKPSA